MKWIIVGIAVAIILVFVTAHLVRNSGRARSGREGGPTGGAGQDGASDGAGDGGDGGD